jgi:hypothetical protein
VIVAPRASFAACQLVALTLCALLMGCGSSSSTMSTAQIEKSISHTILRERGIRTSVRCPSRVQRKAGTEFVCSANLEVGSYPIAVTETDSRGRTRFGNTAPLVILNIAKVKRAIEASILAQRRLRAKVSCPAQVLQRAGIKFACTAVVAGRPYPFAVNETNANGHVSYVGLR